MSNSAQHRLLDTDDSSEPEAEAVHLPRHVPRISIQAFCETDAVAQPIMRAGSDRRMASAHLKVHMGGITTAIEFYRSARSPNLIIVESHAEPAELLPSLARLAELCDPASLVLVIGHHNDIGVYRELIRSGIAEYVVAPVSTAEVIDVVAAIFADLESEPIGRSIAFVGARGGAGSSTIAHNVGWAISSLFSAKVVVADLDLAFGTASINFDRDPAQGIAEAVFAAERRDEINLDRLLDRCSDHLALLAAPSTLDRVYDLQPDAFWPVIDSAQRTASLLVLDVPHIWSGWAKNTLMRADDVVITATPELATMRNAKNLVDMLKRLRPNDPPPRLIVNQAGVPKRPEISAIDFAEPLGITPMAVIPFEPRLFGSAANHGRMLGEIDAAHPIAAAIDEIAHVVTGRSVARASRKEGLGRLFELMKRKG
jgi:pilus assembly protein CpaE